ncbi:hypothetical protein LJN54_01620 [Cellulomonas sp. zg-Y138]|nr:hypothetical protein [Cellulomonas chengniuliangii]
MSIVVSALALSGCVITPPLVETVRSPTPGECEAAFANLADATAPDPGVNEHPVLAVVPEEVPDRGKEKFAAALASADSAR